jgi:DNA polymerase elongation subunit (family B)
MKFNNYLIYKSDYDMSEKILLGSRLIDVNQKGYSSNRINLPICEKQRLNQNRYGRFKYAWDYPEYKKTPESFFKTPVNKVCIDIENLNGVKGPVKDRPITCISVHKSNIQTGKVKEHKVLYHAGDNEGEIKMLKDAFKYFNSNNLVYNHSMNYDIDLMIRRFKYLTGTKVNITSPVMDWLTVYKKYHLFGKKQRSNSLRTLCDRHGTENKVDFAYDTHDEMYKKDRSKYLEYALQDTKSVYLLDEHPDLNIIKLCLEIAQITNSPITDVANNSTLIENLIYKWLDDRGLVFMNRNPMNQSYPGAFVFDAVPGIHRGVRCYDFKSLYPYMILLWNISPDTITFPNDPEGWQTPAGHWFKRKDVKVGFIPMIVRELLDKREYYKRLYKETGDKKHYYTQWAYKILVNSIYGVFGTKFFRFANYKIAESITLSGQDVIKYCANAVNAFAERGLI